MIIWKIVGSAGRSASDAATSAACSIVAALFSLAHRHRSYYSTPVRRRWFLLAAVLASVVITASGCGGSTAQSEARFGAAYNKFCRQAQSHQGQLTRLAVERIGALMKANRDLPGVAKLESDSVVKAGGKAVGTLTQWMEEAKRRQVKVYADEKALGISCGTAP